MMNLSITRALNHMYPHDGHSRSNVHVNPSKTVNYCQMEGKKIICIELRELPSCTWLGSSPQDKQALKNVDATGPSARVENLPVQRRKRTPSD
jgi:hypothetical protein